MRQPDRAQAEQLDGVVATVNYATEKAKVTVAAADGSVDSAALVAAVESAGYTARLPVPRGPGSVGQTVEQREPDPVAPLRQRLIISAACRSP